MERAKLSLLVIAAISSLAACETAVPDADTEAPEVRLSISGPLIGREEMTNPPREEWLGEIGDQYLDLAADADYRFALTVSDQGGVSEAWLTLSNRLTVRELTSPDIVNEAAGVNQLLTLRGSRSEARTGLSIGGVFRTPPGESILFRMEGSGSDFGGPSGSPNTRLVSVSVASGAR